MKRVVAFAPLVILVVLLMGALAVNAGLHIAGFLGSRSQPDFAEQQRLAFAKVSEAIDAGCLPSAARCARPRCIS